jgi:hypothetical protein
LNEKIFNFDTVKFSRTLAQVQFETKVSKTTLGLNERLRVDFAMNIDGDNFNQPSFEGLGLLRAQSASESVMGKREK